MRSTINTTDAPAAIGPYSQGIIARGLLFTAGQIPLDPTTCELVQGGIREQTHQVIKNLQAILAAAGCTFHDVVKTTVYLKNLQDYAEVNSIYGEYFREQPPARSAVEVSRLPKDVLVEIECVAVASDNK